jgi:hypothetical protein
MGKIAVTDVTYSLRSFLQSSVLFSDAKKPTGILALNRLDNSVAEDVIIEPLPMNFATLQDGVINVNLFVPNLQMTLTGDTGKYIDKSQRNQKRINELDRLMLQSFTPDDESDDAIYFDSYSFTYQQSNVFQDTNFQHYLNVRIEFNAITL